MKVYHNSEAIDIKSRLPVIPLRDVVVFPHMIYPLLVGREFTVKALEEGMRRDKQVLLVAQRSASTDQPGASDLYSVGVVARVLQVLKMPNATLKVLVEGIVRAEVDEVETLTGHLSARIRLVLPEAEERDLGLEALSRSISEKFTEYVRLNKRIPDDVLVSLASIEKYHQRADTIAAHILHKVEIKQRILEALTAKDQFHVLGEVLTEEIEILRLEQELEGTVRESMSRSQREFYLQQQLKAIKDELGQGEEAGADVDDLYDKLETGDYPEQVKAKAEEELKKLSKMHPFSAEASVVRSYIDWLLCLPWGKLSKDRTDFKEVRSILDGDHFGLEKPKKRIIEHLAVMKLAGKVKGPILCLVGPPGVGKTSVGRSIARALGREFVRMSLGGMHDEAEIRGHRRTYIGALPGRIIQSLKKAGSSNPVFLLDEVDKLGKDFRGDPSSALLEVLDPEQNTTFTDNYLEVEFDLSNVLFITTANNVNSIPLPLKDRMETISLPGYLDFEKAEIARQYLVPKLRKELGLSGVQITFDDAALQELIRYYTRESGVRELERQLSSMLRKHAVKMAEGERSKKVVFNQRSVQTLLGARKYVGTTVRTEPTPGYAVGLAWTEVGGEVLPVEVATMKGKSKLTLTGSLGEVMRESGTAALSYIRQHAADFGLAEDFFEHLELHVHFPEGAVPKDGPSAGITVLSAVVSAVTGIPCRVDTAMTGEITLTGDVLPIGGLNEKLLAAKRLGITRLVLPDKNRKTVEELPTDLVKGLTLQYVKTAKEVLLLTLVSSPFVKKTAAQRRISSGSALKSRAHTAR